MLCLREKKESMDWYNHETPRAVRRCHAQVYCALASPAGVNVYINPSAKPTTYPSTPHSPFKITKITGVSYHVWSCVRVVKTVKQKVHV
jgi:hypothetical protein